MNATTTLDRAASVRLDWAPMDIRIVLVGSFGRLYHPHPADGGTWVLISDLGEAFVARRDDGLWLPIVLTEPFVHAEPFVSRHAAQRWAEKALRAPGLLEAAS